MSGMGNPLDHIVQHSLATTPAHWGFLTPKGVITLMSDQISMLILAGLLLCIGLPLFMRRRRGDGEINSLVPGRFANLVEAVCQYLRDEMAEPALEQHTDRFIKFIWTVFFFILTVNLLGLFPFGPISELFHTHLGGTATGNIWVTGTLAVMTLVMMVFNGVRLGGKHYFMHFNPGPWWLAWLLVPLEILGTISRIFALAVRLFANMIAGHTLLAVLLGFILTVWAASGALAGFGIAVPVVLASVAIMFLEILVAFIQTFIFTFLTTLFIGMSVVFEHHPHEHEEHPYLAQEGLSLK